MPSIRIGYSSEFVLRNELVGIGSTATSERLDVAGQIRSENTAGSGGVSTFREYQGFSQVEANITNNITIDNGSGGPYSSLTGEIKITGETTVSSGSTVEVGKTKTLTVTDRFAVPLGETNNRDNAPEAGTTRFNQDFGTLEFFDGINWKTVNSYSRGGAAGRALISGSADSATQYVESFNISTFGGSSYFGDMSEKRTEPAGFSGPTRALFAGGSVPGAVKTIDYNTIASEGNSIDFGDRTEFGYSGGAVSSSTRGVMAGGWGPGTPRSYNTEVMDFVEISTVGDAIDFGDLKPGASHGMASIQSPTRGIFAGGYFSTAPSISSPYDQNHIAMLTIASKGNTIKFGEASSFVARAAGCSNPVRGIFMGGYVPAGRISRMDYLTIASEGNSQTFGDLSSARTEISSTSTNIRGVAAGGSDPSATSKLEYVTFSSLGDATNFGDLSQVRRRGDGASDSHGGLGGF
jgi:hypothetical protein